MFQSLVEPCAALVEDFGEVLVEVLGIQRVAGRRVISSMSMEVSIRSIHCMSDNVAAEADDGGVCEDA
jgi:hypothetical protein